MSPSTPSTSTTPQTSPIWGQSNRRNSLSLRRTMEKTVQSPTSVPNLSTKSGATPRCQSPPKVVRSAPARGLFRGRSVEEAQMITVEGLTPVRSAWYQDPSTPFFEQAFQIERTLGKGSFGQVCAVWSKVDSRLYAVKIPLAPNTKTNRYQEARTLLALPPHKNLVKVYQAWEETDKRILIQTEVCAQSLLEYSSHAIGEDGVWDIIVDLVQVVAHLHRRNLIHNDIKPENVLLTKDGVCRLGDLGLVEDLSQKSHGIEEGDKKYMAPEVLENGSTKATDVFSLGITLLEVATNVDLPSSGDDYHRLRDGQVPTEIFTGKSEDLKELIRLMMEKSPEDRPTCEELLEHPRIMERIEKRDKFTEDVEKENHPEEHDPPFSPPPSITPSSPKRKRLSDKTSPVIRRRLFDSDSDEGEEEIRRRRPICGTPSSDETPDENFPPKKPPRQLNFDILDD